MNKYKGTLIVVEGLDGVGKSSTENLLKYKYKRHYKSIVLTHEPFVRYPNGKPYTNGVNMYHKIQSPNFHPIGKQACRMFAQNAKEHMQKIIIPSLKQGKTVICDRGLLSSLAYQGEYRNVNGKIKDVNNIMDVNRQIQGKYMVKPDANVYLYLNNRDEIERITGRAIGKTHKIDKYDRDLTRGKKLNYMKKQYNFAIRDEHNKLGVHTWKLNAIMQPDQRANYLNLIIQNVSTHKKLHLSNRHIHKLTNTLHHVKSNYQQLQQKTKSLDKNINKIINSFGNSNKKSQLNHNSFIKSDSYNINNHKFSTPLKSTSKSLSRQQKLLIKSKENNINRK